MDKSTIRPGNITHVAQGEYETLRDRFAMAALTGFIAGPLDLEGNMETIVDLSYLYADQMMKRRKE